MAQYILYDFFQVLSLEIGVFIGFDRHILEPTHLKTRWINLSDCLQMVTKVKNWNHLINLMCDIRDHTAHNDYYNPDVKKLKEIRETAPKFLSWLFYQSYQLQQFLYLDEQPIFF